MQIGAVEQVQNVSERDVLERVPGKFKAHLEAKKNPIMAAVKFDRRRQSLGEAFDSFVTDLKLLARGLDIAETDKLIRNAIACKPHDERVRQRCLEKSKTLTLDTAIDIGRMFEETKDGLQVMSGEDPGVEVDKIMRKMAHRGGDTTKQDQPKQGRIRNKHRNAQGADKAHTSHKLSARPKMHSCNKFNKVGHFAQVRRSSKSKVNNLMKEMDQSGEDYFSDGKEEADNEMRLLHVHMSSIRDEGKKQGMTNGGKSCK